METIKPCPLCGADGKLKDARGKIRQGWVGCPACSLYIGWKIDPAGAVARWNRRVIDAPRLPAADAWKVRQGRWRLKSHEQVKDNLSFDRYTCSCCGLEIWHYPEVLPLSTYGYCPRCGADMREADIDGPA